MTGASVVPALPAMNAGTLLRVLFKRPRRPVPDAMGELVTVYRLDRLPLDDIARYRAAFGFAGDAIPLSWWYLPAQRAHLATMLDARFPFRIMGLVHMENTLAAYGAPDPDKPILLRTALRLLPPSTNGALRCVLETSGSADNAPIFSCTSTYLVRRGARSGGAKPVEAASPSSAPAIAQWTLDAAAGRRYARLSGDWNPIHLTGWSARLMGMRAPIIHGMHTLATACAALERAAGRRMAAIDCRFRAPVPLQGTASVSMGETAGEFVVSSAGKPAVTGVYRLD